MNTTKDTINADSLRLLDEKAATRVIEEVKEYCGKDGRLDVYVRSSWLSGQNWARNRAVVTSDQRLNKVWLRRMIKDVPGDGVWPVFVTCNQIDSASLKGAVAIAEYYARRVALPGGRDLPPQIPNLKPEGVSVWSEPTMGRSAEENGQMVKMLVERSEAEGFLSAGYLGCMGKNGWFYERDQFGRETVVSGQATGAWCSATVRHPKGIGSGWAGQSSFDINAVHLNQVANLALDKCIMSLDPVRIEPGRYVTILEPQATMEFFRRIRFGRKQPESIPSDVYSLGFDPAVERMRTKLGLRIMDERINIWQDPTDPLVGSHVAPGVKKIEWVKNGVLTNLEDDWEYHLSQLSDGDPNIIGGGRYMTGNIQIPVDEMIASTQRGLLVTRLSGTQLLDPGSALYGGYTRDGLWLIENGKITKAVRNFRWTESPWFVFNNVAEIGPSVPIFGESGLEFPRQLQQAIGRWVVPTIKINDFSFTSTIDAI